MNSIAQTSSCHLARTDVRVNSLCPGIIQTSMTQIQFDYARGRGTEHKIGQLNPLGRYGIPQGASIPARCRPGRVNDSSHRDRQCRSIPGFRRLELHQWAKHMHRRWAVCVASGGSRKVCVNATVASGSHCTYISCTKSKMAIYFPICIFRLANSSGHG